MFKQDKYSIITAMLSVYQYFFMKKYLGEPIFGQGKYLDRYILIRKKCKKSLVQQHFHGKKIISENDLR